MTTALRNLKVLLVDDDADSRELLGEILGARGASVSTASSVEQALSLFGQERPDVIVSDLGMPGEGGLALIRRVRALSREDGGATVAIAVTGSMASRDRIASVEAGFQAHLAKPVDVATLVRLILELAGSSTAAP